MQSMSANSWTSAPPEVPMKGTFLGIIRSSKLEEIQKLGSRPDPDHPTKPTDTNDLP